MIELQAPKGVRSIQIHGDEYDVADGKIAVPTPDHAAIAQRHGFAPVGAPVPPPAPHLTAPQPAAPYATGPYAHVLNTLRHAGVEVADDVADAALLRVLDETIAATPALLDPGSAELQAQVDAAARAPANTDGAPDPETATQPAIVKWLRTQDVAIPGNISREAAREALRDHLKRAA